MTHPREWKEDAVQKKPHYKQYQFLLHAGLSFCLLRNTPLQPSLLTGFQARSKTNGQEGIL